jgi:hypothetical protein
MNGGEAAVEDMTQREIKFSRSVLYGRERQEQVSVALVTHNSLPADPIKIVSHIRK